MHICVLGAGAWGTTLAQLLAEKGFRVALWARDPDQVKRLRQQGENERSLPGVRLSPELRPESSLQEALSGAGIVLVAVPSQYLRGVLEEASRHLEHACRLVCASKGIEVSSQKPMSAVVAEAIGEKSPVYASLSGPSFADEVSRGLPAAVSLGCRDLEAAQELQRVLSTERFRVYTNDDDIGVELGGAIKNVMALATGISDGLGFGQNARAGLITRGLAEMSRLGLALGGRSETFMGLSGMGDLVLTCTGSLSRNRQVGLRLGGGESLQQILSGMHSVAEGVKTTEAVHLLGRSMGVEMPITDQVRAILYNGKDPREAVRELMTRTLKGE